MSVNLTGSRSLLSPDRAFRAIALTAAIATAATLAIIFVVLVVGSIPAVTASSIPELIAANAGPIFGTVATALIAIVVAGPIGILGAVYLVEFAPKRLAIVLTFIVELIAAIPSVVFGLWALNDLSIRLRDSVEWWIAGSIGKILPFLSEDSDNPAADSVFRAGFLVGIMIIPLVVSLSREIIRAVPISLREGYIGMGATRWETIRHIVLPTARIGIIGALMLALGRALGETIAVTMVIGGSNDVPASLFQPGSTIATRIATTLPEAGEEEKSVLIALGVILFFVSLGLSLVMRLAARQTAKITASVK
jgi:phosphate transport system permease protein